MYISGLVSGSEFSGDGATTSAEATAGRPTPMAIPVAAAAVMKSRLESAAVLSSGELAAFWSFFGVFIGHPCSSKVP